MLFQLLEPSLPAETARQALSFAKEPSPSRCQQLQQHGAAAAAELQRTMPMPAQHGRTMAHQHTARSHGQALEPALAQALGQARVPALEQAPARPRLRDQTPLHVPMQQPSPPCRQSGLPSKATTACSSRLLQPFSALAGPHLGG